MITFAYDIKQKRVGCAIVQRCLGANIDNFELTKFNNWITHPTEDMKVYSVESKEELQKVIDFNNKNNKGL